jgi:hypothetical protein
MKGNVGVGDMLLVAATIEPTQFQAKPTAENYVVLKR